MNRKLAASALSALLYAQGLLGVATLGAVLMKDHAPGPAAITIAAVPLASAWR